MLQVVLPDAETGGRSSDVCLGGAAGTQSGIEAQPDRSAGAPFRVTFQLREGTQVDLHPVLDQQGEVIRQLLRAEGNFLRAHPGSHGSSNLVPGTGVEMEAHLIEDSQYGDVRAGLHRIANSQPKGVGESQGGLCLREKGSLMIHENRGAEIRPDAFGCLVVEKTQGFDHWLMLGGRKGEG